MGRTPIRSSHSLGTFRRGRSRSTVRGMATDDALKKAKDLLKKQKKTLDKGEKKHEKLVEAKTERDSSK